MTLSNETLVQCTDLGKCYQIYDNPKARLKQAILRGRKQYYREFWALRHLNFEVKAGESLGIIGRNGSGKSTLLQLICGTLNPTEGTVETNGKIAALLELGSGFNPEFTGLENVYLNASMLGLSRTETDARLEDILSFADIGEFIHQPVKTYSSGMAVRLAFAVIAHVEADMLIVDEALAVGDAIFVQRCMRFIRRMREERCLLFVSHDSEAVKSLCSHALWITNGKVQSYGSCKSVCLDYLQYCNATSYGEEVTLSRVEGSKKSQETYDTGPRPEVSSETSRIDTSIDYGSVAIAEDNMRNANGWQTGAAELISVEIQEADSKTRLAHLRGGELVQILITAKANQYLRNPIIGFIFKDRLGQALFGENTYSAPESVANRAAEPNDIITASFKLWMPMLRNGDYTLMASIADGDLESNTQHHWLEDAMVITISSSKVGYGIVGAFFKSIDIKISPM